MAEKPILFSAPMVRALLAGTKTQTRRPVKSQPPNDIGAILTGLYHPTVVDRHGEEQPGPETFGAYSEDGRWAVRCPYGQPGDRLWVRESFAHMYRDNSNPEFRHPEDVAYMADGMHPDPYVYGGWKPSIHMPRWASRTILDVTAVRVERLQDISDADAWAEGIDAAEALSMGCSDGARASYSALWERINGAGSWDANPWVWVVAFSVVGPGHG